MSKDKPVSPTDNTEEVTKLGQQTDESPTSDNQDIDKSEESSTSEESKSEVSTLDLVKDALGKETKEEDTTEGSSEKDDAKADDSKEKAAVEDSDEMSAEEIDVLRKLKPKTAKRIEQLQARYRDERGLREKAEVGAGYYKQFTDFLQNNQITQDEANELFDIGALMKSNPAEALRKITPYYNQLIEVTGNVLPQDLHQQVEQRQISEAMALELSRQRAHNRNTQAAMQQRQQAQTVQQENHQRELVGEIQGALATWDNQWKKSDPDYNLKSARVMDRVKLIWYEHQKNGTFPKSVEEAVRIATDVRTDVEKELRKFMPGRKPVSSVDGGSSVTAKAAPETTLDVIRQTLGA